MHANNDNHAYIVLRCIIVVLLLINPYYKKERCYTITVFVKCTTVVLYNRVVDHVDSKRKPWKKLKNAIYV